MAIAFIKYKLLLGDLCAAARKMRCKKRPLLHAIAFC